MTEVPDHRLKLLPLVSPVAVWRSYRCGETFHAQSREDSRCPPVPGLAEGEAGFATQKRPAGHCSRDNSHRYKTKTTLLEEINK